MQEQGRKRYERWIRMILPMADLFLVKAVVVLRASVSERVVAWVISLHQYLPRPVASSRTSGNLSNELEGSLCGSKVGQSQTSIDRYHTDQGDVGKIVPLRQHLRSHQHVKFAFAEFHELFLEVAAARSCVAIDSANAKSREEFRQQGFNLFSALPNIVDVLPFAGRTSIRRHLTMVTVVAEDYSFAAMVSKCDVAIWTLDRLSA